jgi:phosphoribosylamine-glycine ligase
MFHRSTKVTKHSNSERLQTHWRSDTDTGGMGAVSPVPHVDVVLMDKIETRIVKPTGLQKDGIHTKALYL